MCGCNRYPVAAPLPWVLLPPSDRARVQLRRHAVESLKRAAATSSPPPRPVPTERAVLKVLTSSPLRDEGIGST
jgi:hypothetical protein